MRIEDRVIVALSCLIVACADDPQDDVDTAEQHAEAPQGLWQGAGPHPCSPATPVVELPPTTFVGVPAPVRGFVQQQYSIKLPVDAKICVTVSPEALALRDGDVWAVMVNKKPVWSYEMCHPTKFGTKPALGCEFVRTKEHFEVAIQLPAGAHDVTVQLRDKAADKKRVAITAQGPAVTTISPAKATAGQTVTIKGEGFTRTPGALHVAIGSHVFPIGSINSAEDTIKVTVPAQPVVGSFALSNALAGVLAQEPFDGGNWACKPPFEIGTYTQPASDSVGFEALIEAAGYAWSSNSGWVDASAGNLCRGAETELLLVKNESSFFSVLGGPTPRVLAKANLNSNLSHPWRTFAVGNLIVSPPGEADYDEFVALRRTTAANTVDIIVGSADPSSCEPRVLMSTVLGSQGNSEWVDAAIGDFDGDGLKEIALVKNEHSNVLIVKVQQGSLVPVFSTDLDSSASAPWKAIAAGNLDGVPGDEIVLARNVSDNVRSTVIAYKLVGNELLPLGSSTFGNNGNSKWTTATIGDFNGDGRASVVLAKNEHSNFTMMQLLPQSLGLSVVATHDLDSATGQDWKGLTAVDWSPRGDRGAHELVAVREARVPYYVDVFVYGNAFHRRARDSAQVNLKGQEFGSYNLLTPEEIGQRVVDTGTTTYQWFIAGVGDYERLTKFLKEYSAHPAAYCVGGQQLRIWVSLKLYTKGCSPPEDSGFTEWNELDYFPAGGGYPSCLDYHGWAKVVNRLAQDYPQIVALGMDDMSHSLYTGSAQPCPTPTPEEAEAHDYDSCHALITEDDIANLSADLRTDSFWLSFAPSFYARAGGELTHDRFRDIGKAIDTIVMFFRNEVVGHCDASCTIDIPACDGQCLAGTCADATMPNAACELHDFQAMVPAGRPIHLGIYATTHSCSVTHGLDIPGASTPTDRYTYDLARLALANPAFGFGGAMIYEAQSPSQTCANGSCTYCNDTLALPDKYCAVQRAFRGAPSSPFDPWSTTCQ